MSFIQRYGRCIYAKVNPEENPTNPYSEGIWKDELLWEDNIIWP